MSQPVGCIQRRIGHDDSIRSIHDRWIKLAPVTSRKSELAQYFPLFLSRRPLTILNRSSYKSFILFYYHTLKEYIKKYIHSHGFRGFFVNIINFSNSHNF